MSDLMLLIEEIIDQLMVEEILDGEDWQESMQYALKSASRRIAEEQDCIFDYLEDEGYKDVNRFEVLLHATRRLKSKRYELALMN